MSNVQLTEREHPFVLVLGLNLADQDSSGFAFDEAVRIASRINGSQMHIVHVVAPETTDASSRHQTSLLQLYVSDKMAAAELASPPCAVIHVRRGEAGHEIAQLAADVHADMIVVGTRKAPYLKSLFVGSTAQRVMATATCPVFVAGPRPRPEPSHLIVIEPPCPDCVQQRVTTGGKAWWCARHSESHHLRHRHVYSYRADVPFAEHDSEISAIGTD